MAPLIFGGELASRSDMSRSPLLQCSNKLTALISTELTVAVLPSHDASIARKCNVHYSIAGELSRALPKPWLCNGHYVKTKPLYEMKVS